MKVLMWQDQDAMWRRAIRSKVIPRIFDDERKRSCLTAATSINCWCHHPRLSSARKNAGVEHDEIKSE
jgi:hypothetical protein